MLLQHLFVVVVLLVLLECLLSDVNQNYHISIHNCYYPILIPRIGQNKMNETG